MTDDIIAALSTAWGEGGIAIVRVSGEGSAALVGKIFKSRIPFEQQPARYMTLGTLYGADGNAFDRVLAVRFEKNASYTAEESAEIHCHGGSAAASRCIEELCAKGARMAQPGEFTRRAFLNGRIDMAQAEAVSGIIRAQSDSALAASMRTLQGGFTAQIQILSDTITTLAAALEVDLDFPEDGEGFISREEITSRFAEVIGLCADLTAKCRSGMLLREGLRVAIIGAPNVGKSSLLNALLCRDRAIVTPIAGTTRDSIEETFVYKGLPIRIVDTAGIREAKDKIEAIGVERAKKAMNEADIVLYVADKPAAVAGECPSENIGSVINVFNKCDITDYSCERQKQKKAVFISAKTGEGIEHLKEALFTAAVHGNNISDAYGVSARQMECLNNVLTALQRAKNAHLSFAGADAVISSVNEARAHLASLLGIDAGEALLDKVFGSFCVGK